MANTTIALKKSSVPSSIPSSLADGEIAINYADGKLYYKNTAGYVVELKTTDLGNYFGSVNANGTIVVADTTSDVFSLVPGDNIQIVGDAINDTITISASLTAGDPSYAYSQANAAYSQANAAYLQANLGGGTTVNVGYNPPSSANSGDLWWNSNTGRLLVYYTDTDSSQWVDASPIGLQGPQGVTGSSGNVAVGTVTTLSPASSATVSNSGNGSYAILDFGVPRGNTITVGTTTTTAPNTPVSITNSGNASDIVLNFNIPRNNSVTLGTVTILSPNTTPTITNGGTASDIVLNFGIPRPNSVTLGTTTTLAPNTPPTVTNSGTAADIKLDFGIPRNNTTTVGTTTTLAPGSAATVSNGGTASDIVLNFGVPLGNVGNTGAMGPKAISIPVPQTGDEYMVFFTDKALTVANVITLTTSQTVSWANSYVRANLYYAADRTSVATPVFTMTTTGNTKVANSITSYTNATITANTLVWVKLDSVVNSPSEFHMTLIFS